MVRGTLEDWVAHRKNRRIVRRQHEPELVAEIREQHCKFSAPRFWRGYHDVSTVPLRPRRRLVPGLRAAVAWFRENGPEPLARFEHALEEYDVSFAEPQPNRDELVS